MRTALLCATVLVPALTVAKGQERPLSYHGWTLGISLDSAKKLTEAQIAKPLVCVGLDTKTMFCQTEMGARRYVSLYFSPVPRRLEEISLMLPLDRRASRDSLTRWFRTQWGAPIPRELVGTRNSTPTPVAMDSEVIGSWARDGMKAFGMAAITSYDTTRTLSVAIANMERQIRLMLQRADTSRRR